MAVSTFFVGALLASAGLGAVAAEQPMPVSPAAEIVGQLWDFRADDKGVVDAFVILGEQKGLAAGYADLNLARAAAIALPGVEAIFERGQKSFSLYAVRLIDNTPENLARLAKGELTTLTEDSPEVLEYRKLKCAMKFELLLKVKPQREPGVINLADERGLFVRSYRMREAVRGAKLFRTTVDRELTNGNFMEAKEVYLFLEDLNVKNQDLEVVQATVQWNLRKFMQSESPELRAFAEAEMKRRGYSEKQIADILR